MAFLSDSCPKLAPTNCWLIKIIGAGRAMALNMETILLASSGVKRPVICAFPPEIFSCTVAQSLSLIWRSMETQTNLPTLRPVISSKIFAPSSLNCKAICGTPVVWSKSIWLPFKYRPVKAVGMNCVEVPTSKFHKIPKAG